MAKAKSINKSQAVRDYLSTQPDAMPKDVMAALAKDGIDVSRILVSTVKNKLKNGSAGQKAAAKRAAKKRVAKKRSARKRAVVAASPAAPTVVEKPATNSGTITLDQIKMVAQTIYALGGYERVTEVLEVIKELGGVKKFKDLAEAISVMPTVTNDDIPF